MGVEKDTFWSEIGCRFCEQGGKRPPRIPRYTPPPPPPSGTNLPQFFIFFSLIYLTLVVLPTCMVSKYSCSLLLNCIEPILVFRVFIVVSDFKLSKDMSTGHEKVIGQIHKRDQSGGKMHVLCENSLDFMVRFIISSYARYAG